MGALTVVAGYEPLAAHDLQKLEHGRVPGLARHGEGVMHLAHRAGAAPPQRAEDLQLALGGARGRRLRSLHRTLLRGTEGRSTKRLVESTKMFVDVPARRIEGRACRPTGPGPSRGCRGNDTRGCQPHLVVRGFAARSPLDPAPASGPAWIATIRESAGATRAIIAPAHMRSIAV